MQKGKITKIMFSLQCKILSCLFSTLICSLQLSVKLTERKVAINMAYLISIVLKSTAAMITAMNQQLDGQICCQMEA